ncbi:MAG: S-layer homology domain-containing protein [Clostridia bacterium]|nr:S-layer homology domain-containing protein [Clostridia bacterium]
MKISLKRALCVLVIAAMLLCALPAAMAADTAAQDGMSVLRTLTRSDLVTKTVSVSSPDETVTLLVPYSFADKTIKLSSGTDFTAIAGFSDISLEFSGPATVDGAPVALTVSYTVDGDSSGQTYSTVYSVRVVRATAVDAEFEGTVSKNVTEGSSVGFSSSDFSSLYTQNDGKALAGVKINGTNPSWGALRLGSSEYDGKILTVSELNNLSFTATGGGSVTYRAYAYDDIRNGSQIGEVTVTITSDTLSPVSSAVTYSVRENETLNFLSSDFLAAVKNLPSGASLTKVRFTSYPTLGSMTCAGASVNNSTEYFLTSSGSPMLSGVTYKSTGGSGTDTIGYVAYASDGTQVNGSVQITVKSKDPDKITYTVEAGNAVVFNASDFTRVFNSYDSGATLHHVIISAPAAKLGSLYKNYTSASNLGTRVVAGTDTGNLYVSGATATQLGRAAFIPTSTLTAQNISLYYAAYDTSSHVLYNGEIVVSVQLQGSSGTVQYNCNKNGSVKFAASNFRYRGESSTWSTPAYITIDDLPLATQGYIYCGSTSSTSNRIKSTDIGSTRYYYSATGLNYIANLTFVARTGFTGDVAVPFTAYSANGDVIYEGRIEITVTGSTSGSPDNVHDIFYEVNSDDYVKFSVSDFNNVCLDATGSNLNYVQFTLPSTSRGRLFLDYSAAKSSGTTVTANTRYYRSNTPKIGDISFVPNTSYNGSFTIEYIGYSTSGDDFSGYIEITVNETDSSLITYNVTRNGFVNFKKADFNNVCKNETGEALDHIKFTTASTAYGRLYYEYKSSSASGKTVSTSTNYYYSGSDNNLISNLYFVPNTSSDATVTLKYTGYDVYNDTFAGEIKIRITGSGTNEDNTDSDDVITYSLRNDSTVKLNASDFNVMSRNKTGDILDYVRFTPPSSMYGNFYVNYVSASSPGVMINGSTNYYRTGNTPLIADITFVPSQSYTGTFDMPFTGYDVEGVRFSGKVRLAVSQGTANPVNNNEVKTATRISYKTDPGAPVAFTVNDFNAACYGATGKTLSYVNFSIPNAAMGTLYADYSSQGSAGNPVTAGTNYYFNTTPLISQVSFVPDASFTGSATVSYTGYATDGTSYSGSVVITVGEDTSGGSAHFTDVGRNLSWAIQGVDYLYENGIITGTSEGIYSPMSNIKRGDFILMLQRAFRFEAQGNAAQFADVAPTSYYAAAILAAKSNDIAKGSGDNLFAPETSLTREDAMVLVVRVLEKAGESPVKGSASDIVSFVDKGDVSGYAVDAVATLVRAGYILGSDGKLNPKSNITRAEMAVLLYRIITK